jgi:cytochrome c-type biogenesis protein CcmE
MHPSRKRRIRLVVALSAAVILAVGLVYTSFSASNETVQPSELQSAAGGGTYQLTGKVADGSIRERSGGVEFRVRDREGSASVPVSYSGAVPDPFREGREVIVTVRKQGATYVGERDTLITKCPSKFTEDSTAKT